MNRTLHIGGTYRHCKGGLYTVLGTIPITEEMAASEGWWLKTDLMGVLHFASGLAAGDTAVVYSNAEGAKFLREKANFLAVLGKPTSQYYRFEEKIPNDQSPQSIHRSR